jgi:hypothetical protein
MDHDPTSDDPTADDPTAEETDIVAAVGKASEAVEYVERARGHLYTFHQLMGRADLLFGEAADMLAAAGASEEAERLRVEIVGLNVLDGRWTFQVVDEFEDLYYSQARGAVTRLEARYQGGRRHVFEARLKEARRTKGRPGHERQPAASTEPGRDEDDG